MMLGVVEKVANSGKRTILRVRVDDSVYRDVVLAHALGFQSRVVEGSRVCIGQLDGDDVTYIAWPIELALQTEDVLIRRADGIEIRLRDDAIDIVGSKVSVTDGDNGAALATKADIDALTNSFNALVTVFNAHIHPAGTPSTGATATPAQPAQPAVGTIVLEAK